jgi:hypothetical protein
LEEQRLRLLLNFSSSNNNSSSLQDQGAQSPGDIMIHDSIFALFSRLNLSPSPQATSHQNLNNGQKFYYQLQSSLSALSGVNSTTSTSSSNNESNASKHSINQLSLNNKSNTDYLHNSEFVIHSPS